MFQALMGIGLILVVVLGVIYLVAKLTLTE
jgi:hypothetical protein